MCKDEEKLFMEKVSSWRTKLPSAPRHGEKLNLWLSAQRARVEQLTAYRPPAPKPLPAVWPKKLYEGWF